MIFPTGQLIHENLKTSFTQLDAMLADLKSNHFTGYMRVTAWEYEGVLFFKTGSVVCAIDEVKSERRSGGIAAERIATQGRTKDSAISVYSLPEETVTLLASMGEAKLVHKDLTSDFTSLDKLVAKLQGDGHTGRIEVTLNGGKGAGLVFFQSGHLVESILATNGDTITGTQVLPEMIAIVSRFGAIFNVYSGTHDNPLNSSTEIDAGLALPQLIGIWEEIIGTIERTVDSLFTKGRFLDVFKHTLNEKARDYPFMLPVSGEFKYADGRVTFGGLTEDLSKGLGVCLSATVAKLAAESPKSSLTVKVKAELQQVKQKHAGAIQNLGLESKCDLLDMILYERVLAEALPFLGNNTASFIEQQCQKQIGVTPETLTGDHLGTLAQRVEVSAALMIPREKAQALRQKIESLAT